MQMRSGSAFQPSLLLKHGDPSEHYSQFSSETPDYDASNVLIFIWIPST